MLLAYAPDEWDLPLEGTVGPQNEIARIFRMRQPRRVNLRRAALGACICLLFDGQSDARTLGHRERLKRTEFTLAEDGIHLPDHELNSNAMDMRCIAG